jgi:hypothetical protein
MKEKIRFERWVQKMFFGERERERGIQGDRKTEKEEKEESQRVREIVHRGRK